MKGNATMKKIFLFLSLFIIVALACDLSVAITPTANPAPLPTNTLIPNVENSTAIPASVTPIPTTVAPVMTPTVSHPSTEGAEVFYGPLSLVLPPGVASGISGSQFSRNEGTDVAPWEVTPGHTQLKLEGYLVQGKFHEPQIYVYPAQAYAEMYAPAFESLHRLNNILGGSPISNDQLPAVPVFNAAQVFASNIQVISFQNGQGVRFLTEYAQYPAAVNNHDLFYHFEGVTSDGAYYIIAILPITVPVLAETSDGGAVLPAGGIPYPDMADPNADVQGYYSTVASLLNATSPETFAPTIGQLDSLIQSMRISP
jgi:hypothetical protein